jgi:hypothetical protein
MVYCFTFEHFTCHSGHSGRPNGRLKSNCLPMLFEPMDRKLRINCEAQKVVSLRSAVFHGP